MDVLSKDIYGVVADIGKFPWKSTGKLEKKHASYHSSFMHTHDLNVPVPYPKSENVEWSETSESLTGCLSVIINMSELLIFVWIQNFSS